MCTFLGMVTHPYFALSVIGVSALFVAGWFLIGWLENTKRWNDVE